MYRCTASRGQFSFAIRRITFGLGYIPLTNLDFCASALLARSWHNVTFGWESDRLLGWRPRGRLVRVRPRCDKPPRRVLRQVGAYYRDLLFCRSTGVSWSREIVKL